MHSRTQNFVHSLFNKDLYNGYTRVHVQFVVIAGYDVDEHRVHAPVLFLLGCAAL